LVGEIVDGSHLQPILSNKQQSGGSPLIRRQRKSFLLRLSLRKAVWLLVAMLFFTPHVAGAAFSLFPSFRSGGESEQLSASAVANSQTLPLLSAVFNINPNPAKGGGDTTIIDNKALLADSGPLGTIADIKDYHSGEISTYVVRAGDSLSQIAEMFNVSVNTIIWANNLERREVIREGQVLVILPVSGVRHVVAKGENIASIAKKYNADLIEILQFNGLETGDVLAVGEEVIVPDGEITAPVVTVQKPSVVSSATTATSFYRRPIQGGVRTQGLHGYNGVDLGTYAGAPIMAAADGIVIASKVGGWNGGYGNYIVVQHSNGTQTLYAHNQTNIVSIGDQVSSGEVIGYVGSTGRSSGSHLHFEVRGGRNPF
jgi:murein DD-endopeptidase MepM/ murein hydrolase activator NlpD